MKSPMNKPMESHRWFKFNYPDLLILLSGVIIGLTPAIPALWKKFGYLTAAIIVIFLVKYIRKKSAKGTEE